MSSAKKVNRITSDTGNDFFPQGTSSWILHNSCGEILIARVEHDESELCNSTFEEGRGELCLKFCRRSKERSNQVDLKFPHI